MLSAQECAIIVQGTSCNWCQHHNLECTFVRERRTRKQRNRTQSDDVRALARRVAQLEDALPQSAPLDASSNTASSSPVAISGQTTASRSPTTDQDTRHAADPRLAFPCHIGISPRPVHFAATYFGPHWFFNGVPIFSDEGQRWVSSKTGQQVKWSEFRTPIYRPTSLPVFHLHEADSDLLELVDRGIAHRVLGPFLSAHDPTPFPLIDPVLLETTLETAYETIDDPLSSPTHVAARACVLAVISIAGRVEIPGFSLSSLDPGALGIKAQRLLSLVPGYASLETLMTVLTLQTQCTLNGNWQNAAFYHAIACRTVCALGYHTYLPPVCDAATLSLEQRRSCHGRKLFWLCYTYDKDISLHAGVPPMLIDEFCDLALPHDCPSNGIGLFSPNTSTDINQAAYVHRISRLPGNIRLSQIKERVCRLLYSPQAFKDFDSQVLSNVRHLDDQIEKWHVSIPSPQRPALVSSSLQLFESRSKSTQSMSCAYLQLEYLHLMVVVHMTVTSSPDISVLAEDRHRLIHSSVDISLEASRSTLSCLKAMINGLAEEAFWPVVRYATPAAITLMLNMLIHPLNDQAQLDLELLISASNLIRRMTTNTLAPVEVECIRDTKSFVMGLVFLGTCAIMKSSREEVDDGI